MNKVIGEHTINDSNNFICGYYLKDTNFCGELIEEFKSNKNKKQALVQEGFHKLVNKNTKDSVDLHFLNIPGELQKKYIQDVLSICVDEYVKKYTFCVKGYPWSIGEAPNIQYYQPGAGFRAWHFERTNYSFEKNGARLLTFMTYLNDVYDEGETEFFYQKVKIKPEKGLTLIWPVEWTHTHRGIVSSTQEKYIATGWLSYEI